MFKAVIIACVIGSPDACMTITDTYGPYAMEGRCRTRLEEMQYQLTGLWQKNNMPLEFRLLICQVEKGHTT